MRRDKGNLEENVSLTVIKTIGDLEGIRDFWEKWQWYPEADIDFYICSAEICPTFVRPHVIVLCSNGQPSALLIGRVRDMSPGWRVGYQFVTRATFRVLEIIYGGVLGKVSYSDSIALIAELKKCLARGTADIVFFDHIRYGSPIYRASIEIPALVHRDHLPFQNVHWKSMLPSNFEVYCKNRTAKTRRLMKRCSRSIDQAFGRNISITCISRREKIAQGLAEVEEVARKTYQRGIGVGYSIGREIVSLSSFAADREWFRVYLLHIGKKPVAYLTGYIYGNTFFGGYTGYDPAYRKVSVGTFLLINIIKRLIEDENVTAFDFGFGDASYKRAYADENWMDAVVYIFAPTIRGLQLNALKTATEAINRIANRALTKFKASKWLKKKWRNRLIPR